MISKNTSKIVLFLLKNPDEIGYNVNRLSKAIDISVGSAFKILKDLEQNNVFTRKNISNGTYYKINLANNEAVKLCELLLLAERRELKRHAKLYAEDISKFKDAELIMLFGSILKGEPYKDVDVLFVSRNVKKINYFCLDISKIRTKPVVPLILKKEDLINEIRKKKDSILHMVKEGVVLKGEEVFIEVIRNV